LKLSAKFASFVGVADGISVGIPVGSDDGSREGSAVGSRVGAGVTYVEYSMIPPAPEGELPKRTLSRPTTWLPEEAVQVEVEVAVDEPEKDTVEPDFKEKDTEAPRKLEVWPHVTAVI
jgi:hypothetical protein